MKLVESLQGQADKFGINLIATGNYTTFLNGKVASLKYGLETFKLCSKVLPLVMCLAKQLQGIIHYLLCVLYTYFYQKEKLTKTKIII